MISKFWMIYNPNAGPPQQMHHFDTEAIAEAERLARANPGVRFVLLEAVDVFEVEMSPVTRTTLSPCSDDVPF
jgi:hypothetical protein